jgi:hypothetical protein
MDLILIEEGSGPLLSAISAFLGLVAGGTIPVEIHPLFFDGRLLALFKKDGGLRTIAVGLSLRRVAAKIINKTTTEKLGPLMAPLELGVGVKGSMEAAVNATRRYFQDMPTSNCAVARLEFKNAFNTIRQNSMLEAVHNAIPESYSFIYASYSSPSILFDGSDTLSSEEGVQQGDPIGPLLFCLAIHPILAKCKAELRVCYMDDITLGEAITARG